MVIVPESLIFFSVPVRSCASDRQRRAARKASAATAALDVAKHGGYLLWLNDARILPKTADLGRTIAASQSAFRTIPMHFPSHEQKQAILEQVLRLADQRLSRRGRARKRAPSSRTTTTRSTSRTSPSRSVEDLYGAAMAHLQFARRFASGMPEDARLQPARRRARLVQPAHRDRDRERRHAVPGRLGRHGGEPPGLHAAPARCIRSSARSATRKAASQSFAAPPGEGAGRVADPRRGRPRDRSRAAEGDRHARAVGARRRARRRRGLGGDARAHGGDRRRAREAARDRGRARRRRRSAPSSPGPRTTTSRSSATATTSSRPSMARTS